MSTLLHVILDRAPALATLAQECKGCPGTLCKGCHGTEHEGGCPYVILTETNQTMSRNYELGTINGCRNLLVPPLHATRRLVTPLSTRAPGSITISRKLRLGRTSFQVTRLLWMIPNLRPSARRRSCPTSATW